jgi:HK97 gp10 family phage protein
VAELFKVEGLKELDDALSLLPEATAKNILRRVGRQALEPVDEAWRANAPYLTGALADSGAIGSKLSRRQRALHQSESTVEVFAGPGPNPQAIQDEFGNQHQHAQPFLTPAWEGNKAKVLDIVKQLLRVEIDKAAARAARKAARLIAKNGG